jgi:hypothetical protein
MSHQGGRDWTRPFAAPVPETPELARIGPVRLNQVRLNLRPGTTLAPMLEASPAMFAMMIAVSLTLWPAQFVCRVESLAGEGQHASHTVTDSTGLRSYPDSTQPFHR